MNMDFTTPRARETVEKTIAQLAEHNYHAEIAANKEEALARIQELIPAGASINNGASTTLQEIGLVEYLKSGGHGWNNLHEAVLAETDPEKQSHLRKEATMAEYYLGSAHAITEDGQIVVASNTGSQLPPLAYTSANIILVVGTQKIVKDLNEAFDRIQTHVVPLEDTRMIGQYGYGTTYAKTLILHKENPAMGRMVRVIFVEEALGF
jgi:L-lactate utilization protein LutC